MSQIANRTILVTGGASGIGRLMVEQFLKMGALKVIVWDLNDLALMELQAEVGSKLSVLKVDLSQPSQIFEAAKKVKSENGGIDILVNNAGVVVGKSFHEHTHRDIEFTLGVNVNALMHTALEFLPAMIMQGRGHIVNIASAAGYVANPKMSVYCGSKWAVIGWSESLRIELEKLKKDLHVTTVTPYYINTGMFDGVKSLIPILKPEDVVGSIVKGILKNRIFVRKPFLIDLLPFCKGILPVRVFDFIVGELLGIYKTMDKFHGHKSGS